MISAEIDSAQFRKLRQNLKRFSKEFEKKVMVEVDSAALTTKSEAVKNIQRNKTTHEGNLARSTKILRMPKQMKARVFTDAGYGKYIEYGRLPGTWPNIGSLKKWVRLKLKVQPSEVDGATFAIAKKIKERGTRPQPFMRPAFEVGRKQLLRQTKRLVDRL